MARKRKPRSSPDRHEKALVVGRDMLARLFGGHADTIPGYTRQGMPTIEPGGPGVAGRYDAVACLAWWRVRKVGSLESDKARNQRAQADRTELQIAERKKQLVARVQVILEGQDYTKRVKARLLALARELVQRGIVPKEREAEVRALVLEALAEMAGWWVNQEQIEEATR